MRWVAAPGRARERVPSLSRSGSRMPPSLQALAPVFLLIAAGQVMRRAAFPAPGFWAMAERLVYWCLFPALLFEATAGVAVGGRHILLVGLATGGPVLLLVLLLLALRRPLRLDGARVAAVAQAAVRPNTYIGLAAAAALWGHGALAPLALVIAINIPLVNLIAGILLAVTGGRGVHPLRLALLVIGNPLILACLLGLAASAATSPCRRWRAPRSTFSGAPRSPWRSSPSAPRSSFVISKGASGRSCWAPCSSSRPCRR